MNYEQWEEWFLRANKKKHEATMKVWELQDNGDTSSDTYRAWMKEAIEWKESEDTAISEHPKHHATYLNRRGTTSESRASAAANGSKGNSPLSDKDEFPPALVIYAMICALISVIQNGFEYGLSSYMNVVFKPIVLLKNNTNELIIYSIFLAIAFGISWVLFMKSLKSKNYWPSIIFMAIFFGLPLYNFYK